MPIEVPTEIRVYDCCGMLGWYIPWATWKAHSSLPLVPTRRFDQPHVYLYSDKAQFDQSRTLRPPMRAIATQMLGVVCLDNYISAVTQAVMWSDVEREIRKQYQDHATAKEANDNTTLENPQGSAPAEAPPEEKS